MDRAKKSKILKSLDEADKRLLKAKKEQEDKIQKKKQDELSKKQLAEMKIQEANERKEKEVSELQGHL